ncbi:MAG: hypothetical protein K8T10_05750 [Candidatus Eremiobacteraeota bacterium]|nr:hypothetical protein [Candidatus Eremiobacteraeota bacterium]
MLNIKQMKLNIVLDHEDCDKLSTDLLENYNLLLHGIKKGYIEGLGLKISREDKWIINNLINFDSNLLGGDIVYVAPDTIMYYKVPRDDEIIEIGIVGDTSTKEFNDFALRIKTSIFDALESPDQVWEPMKQLNASFKLLVDDSKTVKPGEEEVLAAIEIEDKQARALMAVIKEKDSIFLDKLMEETNAEDLEEITKTFADLGLVNTDFVLLCNKTGQQILRIPDKSALDEISQKGFKCFICGASMSDEKLVRAVSCSDFGKKMLEDDYWFLILVLNALNTLGIGHEKCYIYSGDSPDRNIFLNINNETVMLQLLNRKLTLDDAYLINAHIAAYKLNYLILISTSSVSDLMKSHLEETNPNCFISFIEGLSGIAMKVKKILVGKEKKRLEEILTVMKELTPIPIEELVIRKVLPNGRVKPKSGLEDVILTEMTEAEEQAPSDLAMEPDDANEDKNMVLTSVPGDLGTMPPTKDDFYIEGHSVEDEIIKGFEDGHMDS